MLINAYVITKNGLTAGLFNPKDIMIFEYFVNKPYTKLYAVFLGIGMALIYDSIQNYKLQSVNNEAYISKWRTLQKSNVFIILSYLFGTFFILYTTLAIYPAQ